jgi:hypothetical protein
MVDADMMQKFVLQFLCFTAEPSYLSMSAEGNVAAKQLGAA